MSEKQKPSIFLYTDAADLAVDVRTAMIEAGYLPVKVASLKSVHMLTAPYSVEPAELSAITYAALETIVETAKTTSLHAGNFGLQIARKLLDARKPQA